MGDSILRVTITILAILIFKNLFLKENSPFKILQNNRYTWLNALIVFLIIISFMRAPYEKILHIKFKDLDEYCNFMYAGPIIQKVKLNNNTYFMTHNTYYSRLNLVLLKKEEEWTAFEKTKEIIEKDIVIQTIEFKSKMLIYIYIYTDNNIDKQLPIIKDNLNTKFIIKQFDDRALHDMRYSYAIINSPPKNYHLIINGKRVDLD